MVVGAEKVKIPSLTKATESSRAPPQRAKPITATETTISRTRGLYIKQPVFTWVAKANTQSSDSMI